MRFGKKFSMWTLSSTLRPAVTECYLSFISDNKCELAGWLQCEHVLNKVYLQLMFRLTLYVTSLKWKEYSFQLD